MKHCCLICGGYCRTGICQQCLYELNEIRQEVLYRFALASNRKQTKKLKDMEDYDTIHEGH